MNYNIFHYGIERIKIKPSTKYTLFKLCSIIIYNEKISTYDLPIIIVNQINNSCDIKYHRNVSLITSNHVSDIPCHTLFYLVAMSIINNRINCTNLPKIIIQEIIRFVNRFIDSHMKIYAMNFNVLRIARGMSTLEYSS